jgi:hypothetical protein
LKKLREGFEDCEAKKKVCLAHCFYSLHIDKDELIFLISIQIENKYKNGIFVIVDQREYTIAKLNETKN